MKRNNEGLAPPTSLENMPPTSHETVTQKLPSEETANAQNPSTVDDKEAKTTQDVIAKDESASTDAPDWKQLRSFLDRQHSLRLNVSDLAACAGFHPYRSLPSLLLNHVYQGYLGQACLSHDVQLLGIELQDEEQQWRELAKTAGKATQKALQVALKDKLTTVEGAQSAVTAVQKAAAESKRLTARQLATLTEGARKSTHTNFGTTWESQALDHYERQCGWEVGERNAQIRTWPFDRQGQPLHAPWQDESPSAKRSKKEPCFFSLRGAVDGIRQELAPASDDWDFRRVVVECKHRMYNIQRTPPLYEMIQTTVYCLMYEAEHADLIQVLRKQSAPPDRQETAVEDKTCASEKLPKADTVRQPKSSPKESKKDANLQISTHRISLHDPLFHHERNWNDIVRPRAKSWVDAVYAIRGDDDKRYRLLIAVSAEQLKEAWGILYQECPWLKECDTSYHRDIAPAE